MCSNYKIREYKIVIYDPNIQVEIPELHFNKGTGEIREKKDEELDDEWQRIEKSEEYVRELIKLYSNS